MSKVGEDSQSNGSIVFLDDDDGNPEAAADVNDEQSMEEGEMVEDGEADEANQVGEEEDDEDEEEDEENGQLANSNGVLGESNDLLLDEDEEEEGDEEASNSNQLAAVNSSNSAFVVGQDEEEEEAGDEENAIDMDEELPEEDEDDEEDNGASSAPQVQSVALSGANDLSRPKVTITKNGSSGGTSLLASNSGGKSLLSKVHAANNNAAINGTKNGLLDKRVLAANAAAAKLLPNGNKVIEEITIVDDEEGEEEEEAQDLTNKSMSGEAKESSGSSGSGGAAVAEDLLPKLEEKLLGFPKIFDGIITIGQCMSLSKKSRSDIDVDKDLSILDCPSQVVPLLIKKANQFPAKLKVLEKVDENTKPAAAATTNNSSGQNKNMLTIADFYSSSIGKFLLGVGLSRVKQWYHKDAIGKVKKQIRKEGEAEDLMEDLRKQQEYFNVCRAANASYHFPTEKCDHCDFRSEFKMVLHHHLIYPHSTARKEYRCNYCQFSTRDPKVIQQHVKELHERECRIEPPPQLYECPICPYESGVKSKAAAHISKCLKFFAPEKLQLTKDEYFPTITPKPITKDDIKIYEATLHALRCAALNPTNKMSSMNNLPPGLQQHMYQQQNQNLALGAAAGGSRKNKPAVSRYMQKQQQQQQQMNQFVLNQMNLKSLSPQLFQMLSNSPQLLQNLQPSTLNLLKNPQLVNKLQLQQQAAAAAAGGGGGSGGHGHGHGHHGHGHGGSGGVPSMARTPKGHGGQSLMSNKAQAMAKALESSTNAGAGGSAAAAAAAAAAGSRDGPGPGGRNSGAFVMCEICDGYIKDLEQLRSHMHWIHKVRGHCLPCSKLLC